MTPIPTPPMLQPGDVINLPENDYQAGRGQLRMRITSILTPDPNRIAEITWLQVTGRELIGASEGREHTAVIRVAALNGYPPLRPAPPS